MLDQWVKCPSAWIVADNGLRNFTPTELATNASALMCLTIIAHQSDRETGISKVTYDHFQITMGKSRAIVSRGLKTLLGANLIETTGARGTYRLVNYNPNEGWFKLPCKALYSAGKISFFDDCNLRQKAELDALKLMFLFAAFRDNDSNVAAISYDKITERAGIPRERIKRATSVLAANGIAYSEQMPSSKSEIGVAFGYRLRGIDSRRHQGTLGRSLFSL